MDPILLIVSLILAAGGALMLNRSHDLKSRLEGLTCILFFMLTGWVFLDSLIRRTKNLSYSAVSQVTIAAGVRFGMKRGRIVLLGTGALSFGFLVFLTGFVGLHTMLIVIGSIVGLTGILLLTAVIAGLIGDQYLLLEPEGLRIGDRRGSMLAEWDNIRVIRPGEYQRNPVLFLGFKDAGSLAATGTGGSRGWSAKGILKTLGSNEAWIGCQWMVFTSQYGLNPVLFAKALATYVTDPAVRQGLEEHLKLPQ